jgi:hypothetical protein
MTIQSGPIKNFVPPRIRRTLGAVIRRYALRRAIRQLAALPPRAIPPPELIAGLKYGWGNEAFSASIPVLREVAAQTTVIEGPILECGVGVSTLLLGLMAARRGLSVWSLENELIWYERVKFTVEHHGIGGIHLRFSPLRDYGDFSWYAPRLSTMPKRFDLVFCDGPIGTTRGNRYGLFPIMRDYLGPGTIVILDDAQRAGESETLRRWSLDRRIDVDYHELSGRTLAVVRILD